MGWQNFWRDAEMQILRFFIITIVFSLFLGVLGAEELEKTFLFNFTIYRNGTVEVHSISIIDSFPPKAGIYNEPYVFSLAKNDGTKLYAISTSIARGEGPDEFELDFLELVPCDEVPPDYFPKELRNISKEELKKMECPINRHKSIEKIELEFEAPYSEDAEYFLVENRSKQIGKIKIADFLCKGLDETCIDYCKNRGDPDCPKQVVGKGENVSIKPPFKPEKREEIPIWLYIVLGAVLLAFLAFLILGLRGARNVENIQVR
jgi:hypothetical protein